MEYRSSARRQWLLSSATYSYWKIWMIYGEKLRSCCLLVFILAEKLITNCISFSQKVIYLYQTTLRHVIMNLMLIADSDQYWHFGKKSHFSYHFLCHTFEPPHDKTNKMSVRPAKTQISLGIRPVWSESSLSTCRKLGSLATQWLHSKDADQTGQMSRLIWVFTGRTLILLVLWCCGSFFCNIRINDPDWGVLASHVFSSWVYIGATWVLINISMACIWLFSLYGIAWQLVLIFQTQR